MIPLWLRTTTTTLSHSRLTCGMAVHHDGLIRSMRDDYRFKIYPEYPIGIDNIRNETVPDNEYIELWFGAVEDWQLTKNRRKLAYTICHESKLLPEWIDTINECEMVFFGSKACADFQRNTGDYKIPCYIWPGGVDSHIKYIQRNWDSEPLTFLHTGALQWRKGSHIVCDAFDKAFSDEPVRLIMRSTGYTEMFNELKSKYSHNKKIIFQVFSLRHDEAELFYHDAHVLLYPSFTEGWGLMLPEALMTGLPALVSQCSSMLDQFSEDCGWWIRMKSYPPRFDTGIDVDDLVDKLRYVYNNRQLLPIISTQAHNHAVENLTWETSLNTVYPILNGIK